MDSKIFYSLIILATISTGTSFAAGSLISIQTDDVYYDEGDTILISGSVSTIIGDTQVTIQVFKDGTMIDIAQIKVSQDGNYSHAIFAQGPLWKNEGEYIAKATYGEWNKAETQFTFLPKSKITKTTDSFEVSAGDHGTFDMEYTIRGGTIENITIEPQILGLLVNINSTHKGTMVIDLPRKFIDAEKQNGKDEEFIVLIDNIQTTYVESTTHSETRKITINFEKGDSEIQIIGTHVIPEFDTIVMIILTIGIMSSVLLTKNRFQIKI